MAFKVQGITKHKPALNSFGSIWQHYFFLMLRFAYFVVAIFGGGGRQHDLHYKTKFKEQLSSN